MQVDLEKILLHANERLASVDPSTEPAEAFKRFLKIETERLRIRHRFGLGGYEIMAGRSYMVDLVVSRACQVAASEVAGSDSELSECSVIALGGYGRRDLAPFSDIDLLFLHAGKRSRSVKSFLGKVLYLLWDTGLAVGHSFRSVSECVSIAREDVHSRNAMSEARLITGNSHLFRRLQRELDDSVFRSKRHNDAFFEAMRLEMNTRYEKFGRAVCLQEPNVKESAGGLRDLHTVLWIGHGRYGCGTLDDLRAEDLISGTEYATARRASDFIARVRNEAHFSASRRADLVTLELQPALAANLGYKDKRGFLASELFMRDYYQRAGELHHFSRSFLLRAMEPRRGLRRFTTRVKQVSAKFEFRNGKYYLTLKHGSGDSKGLSQFEVRQGKLFLKEEPGDFQSNPMRLMEVFTVAQAEEVELSDELMLKIRENVSLVGKGFRTSPDAGKVFIEILGQKGKVSSALRMMYETGFLARFLPEFGRITFLVQHDYYHKYTIDEHTLKAIEVLDSLASTPDPRVNNLSRVFNEVEDTAALYLGVFLHDIGKGRGGGHVAKGVRIAQTLCKRLGLEEERTERVVFLVKQHLLMSHLSQRRDTSEEGLVDSFVEKVGDLTNLDMLLLLTYSDTSGVGPGVWTDWKGALLWDLYTRARARLSTGKHDRWDYNRKGWLKQQVLNGLLPGVPASEIERHFAMMPDRYFRAADADKVVQHFKLSKTLDNEPIPTLWRALPEKHCTELTVSACDRAGLFSRIAGTLTANGINILNADLYTREDGVVLDTFNVSQAGSNAPVKAEKWSRVDAQLRAAIEGKLDVDTSVKSWLSEFHSGRRKRRGNTARKAPSVRFDDGASAHSTVIEVRADDEPGLAYRIASTLASLQLDISFARITTEKNHALDIFYVTDESGDKLTALETPDVERALLEALLPASDSRLAKEAV